MYKSLLLEKLKNIDRDFKHPSYYLERKLISEIKLCLKEEAFQTLNAINSLERAKLASDPIRSLKNSFIGSCTLFSRAAIEANVAPEDVFSSSDLFIQHIESLYIRSELVSFEYEMVSSFIKMIETAQTQHYSLPVTLTIKFIHQNITKAITLEDLAKATNRSKPYLSKIFKEEVGMTTTDYIQLHKVELCKNFLDFSYMPISEIGAIFNFCNPAYFSRVFKKHTGLTPHDYRSRSL